MLKFAKFFTICIGFVFNCQIATQWDVVEESDLFQPRMVFSPKPHPLMLSVPVYASSVVFQAPQAPLDDRLRRGAIRGCLLGLSHIRFRKTIKGLKGMRCCYHIHCKITRDGVNFSSEWI